MLKLNDLFQVYFKAATRKSPLLFIVAVLFFK
jgi:hypothetical protein